MGKRVRGWDVRRVRNWQHFSFSGEREAQRRRFCNFQKPAIVCWRKLRTSGRRLLVSGRQIPGRDRASLRRAFGPVGAQLSYKVQRTSGEHDVAGFGQFQRGFESLARIADDDRFFGVMAGHFSKQRRGDGARLAWFGKDDGGSVREENAGDLIYRLVAHRSVNEKNALAAIIFLPEFE